jgi:hypothetical protein
MLHISYIYSYISIDISPFNLKQFSMKKSVLCLFALFLAFSTTLFSQGIIITEIVDGTGTGGYPKYVQISNSDNTIYDVNGYSIKRYSNGNATGVTVYTFPGSQLLPGGSSIVITNIDNLTAGQLRLDFNLSEPANVAHDIGGISGNGDDVYELPDQTGTPIDVYGVIGVDGTDEIWEYTDSYAERKESIVNPTTTFNADEWIIHPKGILTGESSDLSDFISPGSHTFNPSTGSLNLTYPVGGENFNTGETLAFTWTATNVSTIKFQVFLSDINSWEDIEGLTGINATLGTINFTIPTDASEGSSYRIRIVEEAAPYILSESGSFTITDIHFAGLDETFPFNPPHTSEGIPTDVFDLQLQINFKEPIQVGTGNLLIKKVSDNSVVETVDVTDNTKVSIGGPRGATAYFKIQELEASTAYYMELEAGAIKDQATVPNDFAGISGSSTWSFTTGTTNSYVSIYDIQYTTDPSGDSPYATAYLRTSGIVMYKHYESSTLVGFFIQSDNTEWNGLYCSVDGNPDNFIVGDEVSIIGGIIEVDGLTVLDAETISILSNGNTLPEAAVITLPFSEGYESMLVRVENVDCSNPSIGNGEWEISASSNTGIVDDLFFSYSPTLDEEFASITGYLDDSNDTFKLLPTKADDIDSTPTSTANINKDKLQISPNPFTNEIRLSAKNIRKVDFINMAGQTVMEVTHTNGTIPTAELKNGMYILKIQFNDGSSTIQKVIKR